MRPKQVEVSISGKESPPGTATSASGFKRVSSTPRLVVSVLVVSYKTVELTRQCLGSLSAGTRRSYEVVVVDNASGDGTVEMITREFPTVRLIPLQRNVGFARGVNLAACHSTGEYVLLLNPDTRMHPGTIDRLIDFAQAHPRAGLVGGRTLAADGGVSHMSCWGRPTLWSLLCYGTGLSTIFARSSFFDSESLGPWKRDSAREVGVVSGCLLLTSRAVWNRLGGLDERFFMYGEDLDLSIRAAGLGYRPMITPDAVITHVLGGSSSGVSGRVLTLRGKVTAIRKHWTPWRASLGVTLLVIGTAARGYGAHAVHRLSGGRRGREALVWRTVFDDRRAWSTPFPAAVDGLEGPTAPEELRLPPNAPFAVAADPTENGLRSRGESGLA